MTDRADVISGVYVILGYSKKEQIEKQEALEKELSESRLHEFVPLDEESQKRVVMRDRCRQQQKDMIEGRDYS